MRVAGLSPERVKRLAPGTKVLVEAKFKGMDSVNALVLVTISNKPMSVRVTNVVGEILPEVAEKPWPGVAAGAPKIADDQIAESRAGEGAPSADSEPGAQHREDSGDDIAAAEPPVSIVEENEPYESSVGEHEVDCSGEDIAPQPLPGGAGGVEGGFGPSPREPDSGAPQGVCR